MSPRGGSLVTFPSSFEAPAEPDGETQTAAGPSRADAPHLQAGCISPCEDRPCGPDRTVSPARPCRTSSRQVRPSSRDRRDGERAEGRNPGNRSLRHESAGAGCEPDTDLHAVVDDRAGHTASTAEEFDRAFLPLLRGMPPIRFLCQVWPP